MKTALVAATPIAQTDNIELVEGNVYFDPNGLSMDYFKPSETRTTCPWKGVAHYYHVQVGDTVIQDGAWYYPDPKEKAAHIKNFVAFYTSKGIEVQG